MTSAPEVPETPPAKLWELLRRNAKFREVVSQLAGFEEGIRTKRRLDGVSTQAGSRMRGQAMRLLDDLTRSNRIAGEALRWLVPQPIFVHERVELASARRGASELVCALETVELAWSVTSADPAETKSWTRFKSSKSPSGARRLTASSKANLRGWPLRWGPIIRSVSSVDPKLVERRPDELSDWRKYAAAGRRFTLETPWSGSPPGFQRSIQALWNGLANESGAAAETRFFQGWDLLGLLQRIERKLQAANGCIAALVEDLERIRAGLPERVFPPQATAGGGSVRRIAKFGLDLTETELARAEMFSELASRRVFAMRPPVTRSTLIKAFEDLADEFARTTPNDHELVGTKAFWTDFLGVESIERGLQLDRSSAISCYVRLTHAPEGLVARTVNLPKDQIAKWYRDGKLCPPGPESNQRERAEFERIRSVVAPFLRRIDAAYRSTVKQRVEYLRSLSDSVFPIVDLDALIRKPPHKRPRSS